MKHTRKALGTGEEGYVMMAVLVFVLVLLVAGTAFFSMSTYETKSALYRQESSEAFYLADAAVERARAMFVQDRAWRDGWSGVAAGRGTYDLTVRDTAYLGMGDVVQLVATGHVGRAHRRIQIIAELPPSGFGQNTIQGPADIKGNLCLDGPIHVNTEPFDPSHITCGGTYTSGFTVKPPYMYTDPAHFPNATYYYVRGSSTSPAKAHVYDRNGLDITGVVKDSLVGVVSYSNGTKTFTYDFSGSVDKYFNRISPAAVFARAATDSYVVVNFGEVPVVNPPGVNGISAVNLQGGSSIHATVINARFIGATDPQRLDPGCWTGGLFTVKAQKLEPYGGIAVVAGDFESAGNSNADVGTAAWPAYVYVTGDVPKVNANFNLVGAITVLGSWTSTGGPDLTFDTGFLQHIPDYLLNTWTPGVSGTMRVLVWREVAIP